MTQKTTLNIAGMHCKSCAKIIEIGLKEEAGVCSASVNFDSKKASLEFDASRTSEEKISNVIKSLGYKAIHPVK